MGSPIPPIYSNGVLSAARILVLMLSWEAVAHAQLRIVSYNTATGNVAPGVQTVRDGTDIVLRSVGEELKNGIAKPIDVLLLQEQFSNAVSTQSVVNLMNGIYGTAEHPTPYARGTMNAITSDPDGQAGGPAIVYNTQTVSLIQEIRFGTVNGSNQARSTLRYQLRPVGYTASADFYAYNNHYKAGDTSVDRARRQIEANSIRTHPTFGSNALLEGAHVIYAGDHNFYRSSEEAFQTLIAAGNGQAFDPVNRIGTWTNNAQFADVHTQSPCLSGCGASSGMDDRFDFQLVTGEFLDGEGLSYIGGSYHGFGNNGTTFNEAINDTSNTYVFSGVTSHTKAQILDALESVTDHIPVVADYQLPAIMQAIAGMVPATLAVGQAFSLSVTVSNVANVVAAIGADELDYSVTTSGALSGTFLNQLDAALGGGNTHFIGLDTATPGMKSGTITISSLSQQVQNGLINIPVSFEVLAAALAGDYNGNGEVDAADYVLWRMTFGQNVANGSGADGDGDGLIDGDDYTVWRAHFGQMVAGGAGTMTKLADAAVPEPSTCLMVMMSVCLTNLAGGTLRGWTRKN